MHLIFHHITNIKYHKYIFMQSKHNNSYFCTENYDFKIEKHYLRTSEPSSFANTFDLGLCIWYIKLILIVKLSHTVRPSMSQLEAQSGMKTNFILLGPKKDRYIVLMSCIDVGTVLRYLCSSFVESSSQQISQIHQKSHQSQPAQGLFVCLHKPERTYRPVHERAAH